MKGGYKDHNFFDQIISLNNLLLAWKEFKRGKRKRPDIQRFQFDLEENLLVLHQRLVNKTYLHGPYQAFYVTDPKLRHIHKACVADRLVHQAVFRVLYHHFEPRFIFDSYACRIDKGVHRAVYRLERFFRQASKNYYQPVFALKCDIKKFFDTIDQSVLLRLANKVATDEGTRWLIKVILDSFCKTSGKGLPLGNVTSQLFANVYLNELDQFVKHGLREKFYLRYCDDFIILHQSQRYLENLSKVIDIFLQKNLRLSLHPEKIIITKISHGVDFLGYITLPYYRVVRTTTKRRMMRLVTDKNIFSYLGICQHAHTHALKQKLLHGGVD